MIFGRSCEDGTQIDEGLRVDISSAEHAFMHKTIRAFLHTRQCQPTTPPTPPPPQCHLIMAQTSSRTM